MNTIIETLNLYRSFIEEKLKEANYKLPRLPASGMQGTTNPEKVIPVVAIDSLPHANFSLYGLNDASSYNQAPYVLIGYEEEVLGEEDTASILIQACVCSEENYTTQTELKIPDNNAFIDCANLLEWMKQKIVEAHTIGGTTIEYPIRMGSYNQREITYPFSFGYLNFDIKKTGITPLRDKFYER